MTPLLSIAFCPPAEYLSVLSSGPVVLDDLEHYRKQSWRNRLRYLASDGVHDFSVPVVHESSGSVVHGSSGLVINGFSEPATGGGARGGAHSTPITEIRVDYSTSWVRNLRRAITTAYSSAAYFSYFCDDFFAVLESRPEHLWDLDMAMLTFLCRSFGITPRFTLSTSYIPPTLSPEKNSPNPNRESRPVIPGSDFLPVIPGSDRESPAILDLRSAFHPKRPLPPGIQPVKPYFQVFAPRFGFTPGLSAIDLLFNEGPHALIVGL